MHRKKKLIDRTALLSVYVRPILLLCLVVGTLSGFAQTAKVVTGQVTSKETGLPLADVSVMISGSKQGTITDPSGNYTLEVPGEEAVLKFSSIGFEVMELSVKGISKLDIALVPTSGSLDEVIVAGAIMKKKDLTGAVASISSHQIEQTPTTDINQAIEGKLPGVYVKSSAQPGGGASIQIRGNNSIEFGTNPIFVVDGTIIDGAFKHLKSR